MSAFFQPIFCSLLLGAAMGSGLLFAQPIQHPLPPENLVLLEALLKVKASFKGEFLVLSSKHYKDPVSPLCPVDVVLGWGPFMSRDQAELLNISQKDRHFLWVYWGNRWSEEAIVTHTSNVHLIPARASIRQEILKLKSFQKIRLEGRLVDVAHAELAETWKSSLDRNDKGTGACEILYVESIVLLPNQ